MWEEENVWKSVTQCTDYMCGSSSWITLIVWIRQGMARKFALHAAWYMGQLDLLIQTKGICRRCWECLECTWSLWVICTALTTNSQYNSCASTAPRTVFLQLQNSCLTLLDVFEWFMFVTESSWCTFAESLWFLDFDFFAYFRASGAQVYRTSVVCGVAFVQVSFVNFRGKHCLASHVVQSEPIYTWNDRRKDKNWSPLGLLRQIPVLATVEWRWVNERVLPLPQSGASNTAWNPMRFANFQC